MASTPGPLRLKKHHGALCWFTWWYDDAGHRRDKWFGKIVDVPKRAAKSDYNAWRETWHTDDRIRNPRQLDVTCTVTQLAAGYLEHAQKTYRKRGEITSHVFNVSCAMQALIDVYQFKTDRTGKTQRDADGKAIERDADSLDGPQIALLRDWMITAEHGRRRSLKTVNSRLTIIKQAFKWAREYGWVSAETLLDVLSVSRLRKGRSEAKDPVPVLPVDEDHVAQTKAMCPSPIRAMIDLQWVTGMRPGEACDMRLEEIDRSGEIWFYRPGHFKTDHLENTIRIIPLGPRAQKIIAPFLDRLPAAHLFSPAEAQAERLQSKRDSRKHKLWPSHAARLVKNPTSGLGEHYDEETYRKAIHHACARVWQFPDHRTAGQLKKLPAKLRQAHKRDLKAWRDRHHWNPNQLRHAAATRLNKQFGLEEVAVTLGHTDLKTTRIYALPDVSKAVNIARKVG